jgi:hypothetical protein
MARIDQFTLDLGDGAPRVTSFDSETYKARRKQPLRPPDWLKPPRGSTARDAAIAQVSENEKREWRQLHDQELSRFLGEKGGAAFITEDFRQWFMKRGNPAPHHPNVWGAMWMHATQQGLVLKTGRQRHMQDLRSHARLTTEWVGV